MHAVAITMRLIPVVLLVILMAPAALTWLFLSGERRASMIAMVNALKGWTCGSDSDDRELPTA
ncbi:hypothetical protein CG747_08050 [Streptomyces sp. CB02959]|nr:hypothetical protein CG747_08050 [Streptomyces sp. CB02959]